MPRSLRLVPEGGRAVRGVRCMRCPISCGVVRYLPLATSPTPSEQRGTMRRAGHMTDLAFVLALSSGIPMPVWAQSANASWQATPASVLKNTLRNLVAAQDRYRARNPGFAGSIETLHLSTDPEVKTQILGATPNGWRAKATHRARPGKSCVVFVGQLSGTQAPRTEADGEMAGEERVPLCDRME
jgi:hypothetical protein